MTNVNKNSTTYRIEHFVPSERIPELRMVVQEIIDTLPGLTARQLYARTVQLIHGNKYKQRVNTLLGGEYYLPTSLDAGGRNSLVHLVGAANGADGLELIERSFGVRYNPDRVPGEGMASKIVEVRSKKENPTPEAEKNTYQEFESYYQSRIMNCPKEEWRITLENNIPKEDDTTIEDGKIRLSRGYINRLTRIPEDDVIELIYSIVGDFNSIGE